MKIRVLIISILTTIILLSIDSQAQCGSCNKCDENAYRLNKKKNNILVQVDGSEQEKLSVQKKSDDFEEFTDFKDDGQSYETKSQSKILNSQLNTLLLVFIAVILAGIFVRFKSTRHFRVLFMIGFFIYLGFYLGACPCPISAYQNVILAGMGQDVSLFSMLYFLGLIPLTFIFGKVWCGWICHLGTLQELLHIQRKFNILKGPKSQKIMRAIRWILFFGLIVQLAVNQTNWFCKVDPFLVAFNFISVYSIGWHLLGLLIISSIFIHRPFCQAACPIGLVLGWVSKIPGASTLNFNDKCTHCNTCMDNCKIGAISKDNGNHSINNIECNLCGECLSSCTNDALFFKRKNYK